MKKSDKVWPLSVAAGALGAIAALTLAAPGARRSRSPDSAATAAPGSSPFRLRPRQATRCAAVGSALGGGTRAARSSRRSRAARPQQAIRRASPPPAEVPHLSSPENLPPGTTNVPLEPDQGRGMSYLRDLWHAVQTQDISGRDALLLLTQRPLDPNAMPTNGLPAGPQAPPGLRYRWRPGPDAPPPDGLPGGRPPPGRPPPEPRCPTWRHRRRRRSVRRWRLR